jgi:hypothetical protein
LKSLCVWKFVFVSLRFIGSLHVQTKLLRVAP